MVKLFSRLQQRAVTLTTAYDHVSVRNLGIRLAVIVTLVQMGTLSHGNYAGSGDPVHYMIIAHSLAFDRDLDVANDYSDPSGILTEPAGAHAQRSAAGVLRPIHDIGLPLIAAPYFAIAYKFAAASDRLPAGVRELAKINRFIVLRQLMSIMMIGIAICLIVLFFRSCADLTGLKTVSFYWSLVWALSPPISSHSYVFFTEVPSALIAFAAYRALDRQPGYPRILRGVLLGAVIGFLLLVHVRNVGLVLGLSCLAVWRLRHQARTVTGLVCGVVVMIAARALLNWYLWGNPVFGPHARPGEWSGASTFVTVAWTRLTGLLFDARHGLLWSAPIYLLVPAAWFALMREARQRCLELLLVVLPYLIFVVSPLTNIHGWEGGWSPAARFLVPVAPFVAVACPLVLDRSIASPIVVMLMLAQLLLDVLFWQQPMLLWSEGAGPAPLVEHVFGQRFGDWIPYWSDVTSPTLWWVLMLAAGWAALTMALVLNAHSSRRNAVSS